MKPSAHRRRRAAAGILTAGLLLAAIVITVNSLLPQPVVPSMTWTRLLEWSGLYQSLSLPDGELQVHFLDVGNADAVLVRTGDHQMLIDAGEPTDGDTVVDYLKQQGVKALDHVIATHPDADHIGGLPAVLESFPVDHMLMTYAQEEDTPTSYSYERLLTALLDQDIAVTEVAPGQTYALGSASVEILGPASYFAESNNRSVICRITFGQRRFLMMGDAEKKAENALLETGVDLSADVLKIGHHGSHSSTGTAFLKAVSPTHSVISCGAGNRYGHPHPDTLNTLLEAGIHIWRTDRDGTIVITTDGRRLTVGTEQGEENNAA